ncbi:hypothetical protein FHX37_0456 [Haloactinospora alba]|uniref:Uncharacterized protein n=1 Tax=Haloactinospora alba TaxID=405555 RepID=A0A543NFG2_9ACTN|nr:hypothetical protein [Haloactinospora alba]TQN30574.1 hypothetical protein FHX37_0456 [Haloactinospora alba]
MSEVTAHTLQAQGVQALLHLTSAYPELPIGHWTVHHVDHIGPYELGDVPLVTGQMDTIDELYEWVGQLSDCVVSGPRPFGSSAAAELIVSGVRVRLYARLGSDQGEPESVRRAYDEREEVAR